MSTPLVRQTYTTSQLFPNERPTPLQQMVTRITNAVSNFYQSKYGDTYSLSHAQNFANRILKNCVHPLASPESQHTLWSLENQGVSRQDMRELMTHWRVSHSTRERIQR